MRVHLRMGNDAPDAHLTTGADDSHGDLTAVGDEDLREQGDLPRGFDQKERLAVLDSLTVLDEDLGHSPGRLDLDFVHELHRLDDADDLSFFHEITFAHVRL